MEKAPLPSSAYSFYSAPRHANKIILCTFPPPPSTAPPTAQQQERDVSRPRNSRGGGGGRGGRDRGWSLFPSSHSSSALYCGVGKREGKRKENNLGLPSLLLLCPPFSLCARFRRGFFSTKSVGRVSPKANQKTPRLDFFRTPAKQARSIFN